MMHLTDALLLVADLYCAAVGRSRGRVSTMVFGSGDRLDGIAHGKDLTTRSYERAMTWFSRNWPEDAAWPQEVLRPPFEDDPPKESL